MFDLLLLCVAFAVAWRWVLAVRRSSNRVDDWLPRRLRGAEVAYAERTFKSEALGLAARLDRAYRSHGELTLVEFKTRAIARAYRSDVIELSSQRVALEEETGETVCDVAYVLVKRPGDTAGKPVEVKLLSFDEVAALVERHALVRSGAVCGSPTAARRMCEKCAYLEPCRRQFGDR